MLDPAALRGLGGTDLAAWVIDLGRLPAQGRDLGVMLRTRASSRDIPLVFVGGAEDKVARTREVLPDAVFTTRSEMSTAVNRAIANPPTEPVVPSSAFAGYSGTPLPRKLGIKSDSLVAFANAPDGFEETLGDLPHGVTLRRKVGKDAAVTLWFVRSLADLADGIDRMAKIAGGGRLWVCWPKKGFLMLAEPKMKVMTEICSQQLRKIPPTFLQCLMHYKPALKIAGNIKVARNHFLRLLLV